MGNLSRGKDLGRIGKITSFHSGSAVVDALIGSKTALAEMVGISCKETSIVMFSRA